MAPRVFIQKKLTFLSGLVTHLTNDSDHSGTSVTNREFGYLKDIIILLLSAFCFGMGLYRKERALH